MSYTVLARRYRSSTFDEVIGQDHIAQTLKKAIASGRIAHAYLFCGTRGTGKTSMARILAKALNCHAHDGPTTEPCGKCTSCLAIARGDDIDVIEIDAASNTGVDNVRDVIENSQYRPANSRFKIYIIDEAHMLSKQAFNALLKTLEEPPSHVKFILATTEPEKLLPTILSRCQRYDFRNIPTREIAGHLKDLCKREKVKADDDALLLVAKAGAGSMRDSLSLLDRLLSVGEKHLTADMIEQLLGLPKTQLLFDLAQAIGTGDVKAVLSQATAIVQGGLSVDSLIVALVDHLRNLLILRTCGADSTLVEVPGLAMDDLMVQAARFDPGALAQDITILEELRRTLRQSQAGRALLDATLVRLALSGQFASISELLNQLDGGGGGGPRPAGAPPASRPVAAPAAQKKNLEPGDDQPVNITPAPALAAAETSAAAVPQAQAAVLDLPSSAAQQDDDDDDLPAPGKVWDAPRESLSTLMARHRATATATTLPAASLSAPAPAASLPAAPASLSAPVPAAAPAASAHAAPQASAGNGESVDPADLPAVWKSMLAALAVHGPMLHSLISQGQLIGIDEGRVIIRYGPQHETFVRMWEKNGKRDLIRDAASKALNQNVGVKFEIDPTAAPTTTPASGPSASSSPVSSTGASASVAASAGSPGAAMPKPSAPARSYSPRSSAAQPSAAESAPPAPETPSIKVTAELVEALAGANPLIKSIMQTLGGQVIKVE